MREILKRNMENRSAGPSFKDSGSDRGSQNSEVEQPQILILRDDSGAAQSNDGEPDGAKGRNAHAATGFDHEARRVYLALCTRLVQTRYLAISIEATHSIPMQHALCLHLRACLCAEAITRNAIQMHLRVNAARALATVRQ